MHIVCRKKFLCEQMRPQKHGQHFGKKVQLSAFGCVRNVDASVQLNSHHSLDKAGGLGEIGLWINPGKNSTTGIEIYGFYRSNSPVGMFVGC